MSSPFGLHRVVEPAGVLPQQAWRLSTEDRSWPDEVVVDVEVLKLDAASYRQLREQHGEPEKVRRAVLDIVTERGKMHNPVTGSGGMLLGTVRSAGPESPLGLKAGDRIATLVSLTLTPLRIDDELASWSGEGEQVPCRGTAVLFGRSIAAVLPDDLPDELAGAVNHRAEGVGLLRTEFLIMGHSALPSEDDQTEYFRRVGQAFSGHPVVIRTYDLGGDKLPAPFRFGVPRETSGRRPFLR